MIIGGGNTNCNAKFGFKAAEGYDGDRLQLRFDFPRNLVYLERNGGTVYNSVHLPALSQGEYQLAIKVSGEKITAYLDGEEIITAENAGIAEMEQGYIVIAGQYPAQDFAAALHLWKPRDYPQRNPEPDIGPRLRYSPAPFPQFQHLPR